MQQKKSFVKDEKHRSDFSQKTPCQQCQQGVFELVFKINRNYFKNNCENTCKQ